MKLYYYATNIVASLFFQWKGNRKEQKKKSFESFVISVESNKKALNQNAWSIMTDPRPPRLFVV